MPRSVYFMASDVLGSGDQDLGRALMLAAIANFKNTGELPSHILLMNAGVKLCCEGSKVLEDMQELGAAGVKILCCGTCLDWFDLQERLQAGQASNMAEILGVMNGAKRVIRL